MRWLLLSLLVSASCGPQLSVANDEDPRYCSENYPHPEPPELCESSSYGDCCTWEVEDGEGSCRYDYCAFYSDNPCEWALQHKECY